MRRRVLLTGCTGLVGHGIGLTLLARGYEVWGTSRSLIRSRHPAFHPVVLELEDPRSLQAVQPVLEKVHAVIHNAARLPVCREATDTSWQEYFAVNFAATRQLLVYARDRGVSHFVYVSGSCAGLLDNSFTPLQEDTPFMPNNDYAASKAAAEMVCCQFDLEGGIGVCILRFPAPYGYVGGSTAVVPKFISNARAGRPITLWGTGARQQVFTFVEDVGQACFKAIETGRRGVFHIAGPEVVTMKQLADAVLESFPGTGATIAWEGVPDPQETRRIVISIDKARRDLGYEPEFSLLDGLARIARADDSVVFFDRQP